MIIVRTPYRVSFFGGGSDYPAYYRRFGGDVLNCTIDKYCYICLRQMPDFLGSKYRIFWSKMETVDRLEDIEHPGVRGCLEYLGIAEGIEVNHAGDLPARSGLGSSSSFTVGMLHALQVMMGTTPKNLDLADQAISVEQDVLKETVGIQDQIACAMGGMLRTTIEPSGRYTPRELGLFEDVVDNLERHLVLVFTGLQRHASEIASAQIGAMDSNLGVMRDVVAMVPEATNALLSNDMKYFGHLLHQSWQLKSKLSDKITNSDIDDIYGKATNAGAYGGKLLGAGGGGFFLFCVPPDRRQKLIDDLGLIAVPFSLSYGGSELIHKS